MTTLVNYNPKPIAQGADWSLTFKVKDENHNPVNLTGWTGVCKFKERVGGPVLANVTVTVSGATGAVQLSMTAAQTGVLPARNLLGDCFITNTTVTKKLWAGIITMQPKVSQ